MRQWLTKSRTNGMPSYDLIVLKDGVWHHLASDLEITSLSQHHECPMIIHVQNFISTGRVQFGMTIKEIDSSLDFELAKIAMELEECGNG